MKKILGVTIAMMLGISMIGCESTEETDSKVEEKEVKQEQQVEIEEKNSKKENSEEQEKEVDNKVLTFEDKEFKHFMTDSLELDEYEKYFSGIEWTEDGNLREIEFDGYITTIMPSEKYDTRCELGLAAGDYDGIDVYNYTGITIVTRDIGYLDLNGMSEGTNVRVRATIDDSEVTKTGNLKIDIEEIEAR